MSYGITSQIRVQKFDCLSHIINRMSRLSFISPTEKSCSAFLQYAVCWLLLKGHVNNWMLKPFLPALWDCKLMLPSHQAAPSAVHTRLHLQTAAGRMRKWHRATQMQEGHYQTFSPSGSLLCSKERRRKSPCLVQAHNNTHVHAQSQLQWLKELVITVVQKWLDFKLIMCL